MIGVLGYRSISWKSHSIVFISITVNMIISFKNQYSHLSFSSYSQYVESIIATCASSIKIRYRWPPQSSLSIYAINSLS